MTKQDSKMTKGLTILTMVLVHLFCRTGDDVFCKYLLWVTDTKPLLYYVGFFCEICVSVYSFCAGYAHYRLLESSISTKQYMRDTLFRILKFAVNIWAIILLFVFVGFITGKSNMAHTYVLLYAGICVRGSCICCKMGCPGINSIIGNVHYNIISGFCYL